MKEIRTRGLLLQEPELVVGFAVVEDPVKGPLKRVRKVSHVVDRVIEILERDADLPHDLLPLRGADEAEEPFGFLRVHGERLGC